MIVDQFGQFQLLNDSLKPAESEAPIYRARVAMALPKGKWLYGPEQGHELDAYKRVKMTDAKREEFQKMLTSYLDPYGPDVVDRLVKRGEFQIQLQVQGESA